MKLFLHSKIVLMKKILTVLTLATVMVACNSKKETAAEQARQLQTFKDSLRLAADTAGLAQYQAWKAENELNETLDNNDDGQYAAAPVTTRRSSGSSTSRTRSSGSGNVSSQSSNTAMRKKGWSKAAKGAAIGGGSGAVIGAVVNKRNRAAGAVIGGVLGAGVGYGVGRGQDKKDGRY
jgi:hypothetical protein